MAKCLSLQVTIFAVEHAPKPISNVEEARAVVGAVSTREMPDPVLPGHGHGAAVAQQWKSMPGLIFRCGEGASLNIQWHSRHVSIQLAHWVGPREMPGFFGDPRLAY